MMILAPIQFLLQYFNLSTGISMDQSRFEKAARDDIDRAENEVNDEDVSDEESMTDVDTDSSQTDEPNEDLDDEENDIRLLIA